MNIQTFLVVGSIAALTYTILNINNTLGTHTSWQLDNEAIFSATAIGQSIIEEIELKAFDEKTLSGRIETPDSLTSSALLGKETGEFTYSSFDDFDDFNGYVKKDTLDRLGVFSSRIDIYYVTTMSPDNKSLSRTFSKRVDIYVSNTYLADTLFFSKVISY